MGGFRVLGGWCAEAAGGAGGDALGRAVAGRGAGVAGGSGGDRRAAARPRAVRADRGAVGAPGAGAGAADDPDGDLRPPDDRQAALGLGLRDAGPRGLRLAAPEAFLPDPLARAGAGRVDATQADPPAGRRGDGRLDARADREGGQGATLQAPGGADRLDRGGGRSSTRPTRSWRCRGRGRWRARAASSGPA
jgi:hypothetical protein